MLGEIKYLFINHIICNIPFWPIRKILYLAFGMKIGKNARILLKTRIYCPEKIIIGDRTIINEYCYLDGRGGISIGSDVTVAVYTKIITAGHLVDSDGFEYKDSSVIIGDSVAVFADSMILGGAKISNGCVFYARSVVTNGNYEEKGIYAGNPCRFIRLRNSDLSYKQDKWKPLFR